MSQSAGSTSFTLFGIRVDSATPVLTIPMIWESAISRGGMRVVLADLWTLLMAQRDFALWEALSAAEFVLPLGDDPIIRRAAARQHLPVTWADGLLFDLLDAAASSRRRVVIVAPSAELNTDLALMRQVWPELQVTGLLSGESDDRVGDRELARTVNEIGPELLVLGGGSPWQEYWSHAFRDDLEIGAAVLVPTLHPAVAAMAQRAGIPVAGVGPLRRKATIRRALSTTLGPVASASAETVRAWLQEAREELADWSATLQARHRPSPLNQLALPAPGQGAVGPGMRAGRPTNESSGRWAGISPLARLGPPRHGIGLPSAAAGDAQASATQHAPAGPAGDPSHAPEYEADQAPEHIFAASGPSAASGASADSASSGAVHGSPGHQVEPEEPSAIADAGLASSAFDDRQYWAEQPTTVLTVDQLSAASRAAPRPDAASLGGDAARPPAPPYPGAEDPAQGEHGDQSPPDQDPYDDDRLLVFEAHSPADWTTFLAAEEGYDELPPTTKLDPRVVLESGRGSPSSVQISADPAPTQRLRRREPGEPDAPSVPSAQPSTPAQARQAVDVNGEAAPTATENYALDPGSQGREQEHEIVGFARPGRPAVEMPVTARIEPVVDTGAAPSDPAPGHDAAYNESSLEATASSRQPEPGMLRIASRYVVRRSRRRFMRERLYIRGLKSRHQDTRG